MPCELSFVEHGPHGLFPRNPVRDVLDVLARGGVTTLSVEVVAVETPDDTNIIIGRAHFDDLPKKYWWASARIFASEPPSANHRPGRHPPSISARVPSSAGFSG